MKMNRPLRAKIVERFGTQADFAHIIRATEPVISRVVRGRKELPPEQQERWARALGATVEEIFQQ